MYQKGNLYFADWRERKGVRRRKSFANAGTAEAYEKGQKGLAHPKKTATGTTVRHALRRYIAGPRPRHTADAADEIARIAGDMLPRQLSTIQTNHLNKWVGRLPSSATQYYRSGACQTVLRYLAKTEAANPTLADEIQRPAKPRPRNVTATREERVRLLTAARPHLRCWLLLCSDLAIRAGTAATLTPSAYDPEARMLRLRTKYEAISSLPVTEELAAMFAKCPDPHTPFVAQLSGLRSTYGSLNMQFRKLRRKVGITRKLTAHDLRRTTARAVYQLTHDLRTVQALLGHADLAHTMWYLQDDTTPVPLSILEPAKLPPATKGIQ